MNKKRLLSAVLSAALLFTSLFSAANLPAMTAAAATPTVETLDSSDLLDSLMNTATSFITIKHYQLGGSHYAYTEYLNEVIGNGSDNVEGPERGYYKSGSQMVLVELQKKGATVQKTETVLIDSPSGMLRDPDVSTDGKEVLFSWKQSDADDFHLYRANIEELRKDSAAYKQITFGSGDSQTEPKFLPDGNIVFSCSKITQTIDCWHIPVSNLYICGPNGENMVRVGYDQVHTTYPTVTSDGRVLYTRWDYNDRNQMYVQGVFQMFPDGTNQTELYGNDANWPTTLIHTREIPGTSDKYITIGTGHHTRQLGKLMIIDTSKGRNSVDAVDYVFPGENGNTPKTSSSVDNFGQGGPMYKYPYALNEEEFLVAYAPNGRQGGNDLDTRFSIYLMNTSGEKIKLVDGTTGIPASQIVPIKNRSMFVRPSMVNYASKTGTYYMGNVYEGEGMKGVQKGDAKQLRVVALEYRSYAIGATIGAGTGTSDPYTPIATGNGAWDIKRVLGVVDIEEDGSALFKVPANTPIYFQVLDENGDVIQTMRSWSTVMPNETFSCVGCHEDKNTVPPAGASNTSMAMNKGVQEIVPESWQDPDLDPYDPYGSDNAFDYTEQIQPILDESCVSCHSNIQTAYEQINLAASTGNSDEMPSTIIPKGDAWKFTTSRPSRDWNAADFDDSEWSAAHGPFGKDNTAPGSLNTVWESDSIWLRQKVNINKAQLNDLDLYLQVANTREVTVYFNGEQAYNSANASTDYKEIALTDEMKSYLKQGENTIAVIATKGDAGQFIDVGMVGKIHKAADATVSFFKTGQTWKYTTSASNNIDAGWNQIDFRDSAWKSGQAPIGDREGYKTLWNGSEVYLWARQEFEIAAEDLDSFKGATLTANTYYDDDPVFYLNGHQIFSDPERWVDGYTEKKMSADAADYLVAGKNVFAVSLHQHTGGRQWDAGLTAKKNNVNEKVLCDVSQSDWKYTIKDTGSAIDANWTAADFAADGWTAGKVDGVTYAEGKQIWARKTFTVDDAADLRGKKLYLNIKYDENPLVYLNGHLIFSAEGYNDRYHTESLLADYTQYLKQGENVLAVTCFNTAGGSCIDIGVSIRDLQTPVSFEGTNIVGSRQRRYWPLSYLVLTGSTPSGNNWRANTTNQITNWVSSMSQCEILEPRQYGAVKSNLMTMLRSKHQGVELTDEQIRAFAAWIDLGVPCYGSYDGNKNWDVNAMREADEKNNKRAFNDMVNEQHMKARAGLQKGMISVSYIGGGKTYSDEQAGFVELNVPQKYQNGDKVTVKLPEGQKYLMFSLSSRIGESLIYVPSGTFEYTLTNIDKVFPKTVQPSQAVAYINNTITARVATTEDLQTRHNLARNSYDLKSATAAYPHVTTSTDCRNSAEFEGRNAIDGFRADKGHGTYPNQSWGPELQRDDPFDKQNLKIDFGREVYADEVQIYIRADFPHDTYYANATLAFSDGTTEEIQMRGTADAQVFSFAPRKTSYVQLKDLRVVDHAGDDWAGISEIEVYGTEDEVIPEPDEVDWALDTAGNTVTGMETGITVAKFIEGFHGADVKVTDASGKAVAGTALLGTGMKAAYNGVTYTVALPADLNGDGKVTIVDVMEACKILARQAANVKPAPVELIAADLTKNGSVDITDVMEICKILARQA